jgi:hypothetical protein
MKKSNSIKLSVKSGKDGTGTPVWSHRDEIFKNRENKYTELQRNGV